MAEKEWIEIGPVKGDTGPKGDSGDIGIGTVVKGHYNSYAEFITVHPSGSLGDAYIVDGSYYYWNENGWANAGSVKGDTGDTGAKGDKGDKGDNGNSGNKTEEEKTQEMADFYRKNFGGEIHINMPYATDKVNNTFKTGGINNRKNIPNVNGGEDYLANGFNIYDLYIPYKALKENKTKGIFVFIHGGAWMGGSKEDNNYLAKIYYDDGFIVANLNYTLLSQFDHTTNIFRQIDEISACLEHLKNFLVEKGFNKNELQVAVGGGSAGGHLSLLYPYIVVDPPIPVKFIIDVVGPLNLNVSDYLVVLKDEDTLPNFKPETIELALKHREKYSHSYFPDNYTSLLLDLFNGANIQQKKY